MAQFEFACIPLYDITLSASSLRFAQDKLMFNKQLGNELVDGIIDLESIMQATVSSWRRCRADGPDQQRRRPPNNVNRSRPHSQTATFRSLMSYRTATT